MKPTDQNLKKHHHSSEPPYDNYLGLIYSPAQGLNS